MNSIVALTSAHYLLYNLYSRDPFRVIHEQVSCIFVDEIIRVYCSSILYTHPMNAYICKFAIPAALHAIETDIDCTTSWKNIA